MASSFTTSGSTPQTNSFLSGYSSANTGTTPQAKALSSAANMSVAPKVLPPIATPSTPVKSTAVSHPDGTQVTTTYHAPTAGILPSNSSSGTSGTQTASTGNSAPPSTPPTPTYSGLVGQLAGASASGSPAAQGYVSDTSKYGAGNIPIGESAADIAKSYGQKIADVGTKGAQFQGGQLTTGTSPIAEGNAAVTANLTAQEQQALAAGESAALEGTGQQLTAQNQAATAANSAAGQATSAQGQAITGLGTAAGYAQPSATSQGQTTFNPLTGTFSGGSYQTNLQTVVNAIKNGSIGYTDGVNSLSSLSPTAKADVLAQLGSGFDTVASDANAASKGTSITTLGTNAANITAAQQQQIANYKSAQQQGQNLASQTKDLITTFGLNPSELTAANGAIQKIAKNVSSPQYQILSNYLNDISARYSQVLTPPGGSSTDTTRAVASGMLDALASGNSIKSVLDSLDTQATAVISGIPASGAAIGSTAGASDLNSSSVWPGFSGF